MTLTESNLNDLLSHGSGINGDWCFWTTRDGKKIWCSNLFETMTEHGFIDGDAYFTLIIPKDNPQDFRLMFHGDRSQYLNTKYGLRDYLEFLFAEDIHDYLKDQEETA